MVPVVVADKLLGVAGQSIRYQCEPLKKRHLGLHHGRGDRMKADGLVIRCAEGKGIVASKHQAEVVQPE